METWYQLLIEHPNKDEPHERWVIYGMFKTKELAEQEFQKLWNDVNTKTIGDWHVIEVKTVA